MTTTVAPDPLRAPTSVRRRRTKRRLIVVFAVLAAAFVYLLVEGLGNSLDYYETVDQALSHKGTLGTSSFRLEGLVQPGSVHRTSKGADFVLSGSEGRISVQNVGSPPQLFQANIPVIAVGHFAAGGSEQFQSNQIEVKHSASYIAAHPNRVRAPNGSVR